MKQSLARLLFITGFLLLSVRAFAAFNLRLDSITSPSSAIFGTELTYTIAFSNAGPDARNASLRIEGLSNYNLVSLSVTIAGVAQTCSIGARYITCPWVSMASGATGSATLVLTPAQIGIFNLRISLYPLAGDTNSADNRFTRTTAVTLATEDLQLTPSLGSNAPRNLGEIVYYTLVLLNAGPSSAPNTRLTCNFTGPFNLDPGGPDECVVDPAVENSVSCNLGELPSAGRLVTRMDIIPTTVGTFSGVCTLTSDLVDTNLANSSGVVMPSITINPALPVANLAITLGANADSVTAGNPLTYTVTINNSGPETAPQVLVSSNFSLQTTISSISGRWSPNPATVPFTDIPASDCLILPFEEGDDILLGGGGRFSVPSTRCALPSLPSGGQIVVNINASRPSPGAITHNASVSSNGSSDPMAVNNSVTLTTTVTALPPPPADLAISMSGGPNPINLNENLVYTLNVSNSGSPAESVVVTNPLPMGGRLCLVNRYTHSPSGKSDLQLWHRIPNRHLSHRDDDPSQPCRHRDHCSGNHCRHTDQYSKGGGNSP